MSDSSDRLSQRLREQVAALHEPEAGASPALGRDAQRRVVQELVAEANRLNRRRRQRVWLGSGAGALLLAAAVLLAYLRESAPVSPLQLKAAANPPPAVEAPCQLPIVTGAQLASQRFALGELGELVTQPDTQLSVQRSSACELVLQLRSGTLAGDLHGLRPARLVIRTDHGEVIVTGTRFSVHSEAELEVLLETGVVDVQLEGVGKLRLQPGTRLHKGQRAALSNEDARRLDGWLKPAPPPPPPAAAAPAPESRPLFESSSAALAAAEAARRAGRWTSAREAYRFASLGKDSNAEVALLRWARFELEQTAPASALRVVAEHKRRFARGLLGADAGFIEVQAHNALGHSARAKQAARALIQRYPDTPQAAAARKLVENE